MSELNQMTDETVQELRQAAMRGEDIPREKIREAITFLRQKYAIAQDNKTAKASGTKRTATKPSAKGDDLLASFEI